MRQYRDEMGVAAKAGEPLMLVPPDESHAEAVWAYREEHFAHGEQDLHGGALLERMAEYADWLKLVRGNTRRETVFPGWVPADTLLAIRPADGALVGLIDIRLELNDFLRDYGGNIGYGVRPIERDKGYATAMLRLGLRRCRVAGLTEVRISCNAANTASRRTILGNGGVLLREFVHTDGQQVQMFRIALNPPERPEEQL